jgi:DNA-binding IclR family transcriptional regulator
VSHSKTSAAERSPYKVQVLDRALALLEKLSENGPDLTLAEISQSLGLHKSTAHRLVMVLERHRLVEKNTQSGRYRLGLKLFELGTRAVSQLDLRERARPFLERLSLDTGETVHLCVYDAGEVVYLDKVEPSRSVRLASSVGRRSPAYCTAVGKAMIAHVPEAEMETAVQRHGLRQLTRKTIGTLAELKTELARVRTQGFAIDNEENEEGVRCVGSVVRGFGGTLVGAISVSGPSFRVSTEKVGVIAQSVVSTATALSHELGYQQPAARVAQQPRQPVRGQFAGA